MEGLRPLVEAELGRFERERGAAASHKVMQELRRALRGLRDRLPQYELPRVPGDEERAAAATPGGPFELDPGAEESTQEGEEAPAPGEPLPLFPPGPLATVEIAPASCSLAPGAERRVIAAARDGEGRRVSDGLRFVWAIEGGAFTVTGEGPRPAVRADADARAGQSATLRLVATQGDQRAEATASLLVADQPRREDSGFGIPEPELVDDPSTLWRSRFDGERWQVNAAHPDYLGSRGDGRTRFRYLLACLTKEIVQRTHGAIGTEPALESFVEILAHAERNLREAQAAGGKREG
jgi:hypothetical protein